MLDELDVICFGRKNVQELANEAINSGYSSGTLIVKPKDKATQHVPSIEVELEHRKKTGHPLSLSIPSIQRKAEVLDLNSAHVPEIAASELHGFEITDPHTIKKLGGSALMPRAEFIAHASTTAIRKASYLSESLQKNDMIDLVDRFYVTHQFRASAFRCRLRHLQPISRNI